MADNVIVRVPEQQFIKGEDGKDGASAYEQAVAGGYTGTEAQFNEELANFNDLSEQAADSAAAAAQSESNAAGSATTATTKAQEAADSAAQALIRMNSAATSAHTAEDASSFFTSTILPNAVSTVNNTRDQAVANVNVAKSTAVQNVQAEGATQISAVQTESTTQQAAIQQKGEDVLDSIPSDYTELTDDVDDLKSQTNAISPILPVQYEWVEGAYIDESGNVVESANFHYTSLIKVDHMYPVYRVWYGHTGTGFQTNLRIHGYDADGNWVRQINAIAVKDTFYRVPTTIYANDFDYFVISCASDRINIFDVNNIGGDGIKELQIEKANVVDRIGIFGKPTVDYIGKVQENSALTAKTSVFKNGNSYCIIYQENLDGTADDVPSTSGTGVIALKYKYFTLSNGAETNVTYGTIAQKGTSYTDLNGNTAQFAGGVGKPARSGNYIYMTAAEPGTRRYNAIDNYGMVCCRCSVTVTDSGVTFGAIEELSLKIGNVVGKLDVYRIDTQYQNYYIYYTLSAPCKFGQTWHWLLPVVNGFAHLDSSDGKTWTYKHTVGTPFQPYAEVSAKMLSASKMIFSIRCQKPYISTVSGDHTCVGIFNVSGYIEHMYSLPGGICRPFLTRLSNNSFYLLNNENDRYSCTCYYVVYVPQFQLSFYKVFEFFKRGTWYSGTAEESTTSTLFLSGTDGPPTETTPSTFMILSLPNPRTTSQVDFNII